MDVTPDHIIPTSGIPERAQIFNALRQANITHVKVKYDGYWYDPEAYRGEENIPSPDITIGEEPLFPLIGEIAQGLVEDDAEIGPGDGIHGYVIFDATSEKILIENHEPLVDELVTTFECAEPQAAAHEK